MNQVHFIFGVHNHQPVGNFGQVFETLDKVSYHPFLQVLERHPRVKCAFHVTGPLLEWFEANRPETMKKLKALVGRGQVELFTGGMYEPILAVLPDRDKLGQIRRMSAYIEKKFGVKPQGMWTAERVWEPHLTKTLAEGGVKYLVMDDAHFKSAGLREDQTFGYYLMEEQGLTCGVFPISEKMRYMVPFKDVPESINYLRSVATEAGDRCVVLMDDGEKFGGWPDTYKWVYEDGYLERFFGALEANSDWLKSVTFAEYAQKHPPLGRLSLPTGSYTEMGEWALPPDAAQDYENLRHEVQNRGEMPRFERYLKGGFWRHFLAKYDESNQLHKKLLWVSDKVEKARQGLPAKPAAKQKALLEEAETALYRGQCNCAYWHGIFGGLYLNHLRFALYQNLIAAEKCADALLPPSPQGIGAQVLDFNKDGYDEVVVESAGFHALLEPSQGGTLSELDYLLRPINLSDTLTRRREAYHAKLLSLAQTGGPTGGVASIHEIVRVKEPGLEKKLFYDADRRVSLVDRFAPMGTKVDDFYASRAGELADFRRGVFDFKIVPPQRKGQPLKISLSRLGKVEGQPFRLKKNLSFQPGDFDLEVRLELENRGDRELRFLYFTEWNLTLLAGDAPDRNYYVKDRALEHSRLNSLGVEEGVRVAGMTDGWLRLDLLFELEREAKFYRYPVETISQSEGGFERVYQGSCLMFGWELALGPGKSFSASLRHRWKELKKP
jgi:alpha-amylase